MEKVAVSPNDSKSLSAYFVLAFVFSWSIGIPLALTHQGIIPAILPQWTHYLVAFGPMLSALIVTGISQGSPGLKELSGRIFKWSCLKWWVVAFSPLLLGMLVIWILNRFTGSAIRLSDLGIVNYLPPMRVHYALLLWIFTFGLGEEIGWRGFALPRLQKNSSALAATMILAVLWALWHAPQLFYFFDPSMVAGWLIGLFAGAVVLTWLYNSSPDNVLPVAIWHGCFNFMTASIADVGLLPAVMTAIVIVWAVLVIMLAKPKSLMSV